MPIDFDKMEAGPEMDALVHERIFGFRSLRHVDPEYSRDVGATWEIIEKLRRTGDYCCLELHSDHHCIYRMSLTLADLEDERHKPAFAANGETAPLAICRAALKATIKEIA